MNSNFEGNAEQQQANPCYPNPQFPQEQQYAVPSTSTGYVGHNHGVPGTSYNNAIFCNTAAPNYGNTLNHNLNNAPTINYAVPNNISNGMNPPNNYERIILPNGETVVLNKLYKLNLDGTPKPNNVYKRKRVRTVFTDAHIKRLEDEYILNRYLDQTRRQNIAKTLNLTERTVKVWFQNRRMKEKRANQELISSSADEYSCNLGPAVYNIPKYAYGVQHRPLAHQVAQPYTPQINITFDNQPPTYAEAIGFQAPNHQLNSNIAPVPQNFNAFDDVSVIQNIPLPEANNVQYTAEAHVSPANVSDEGVGSSSGHNVGEDVELLDLCDNSLIFTDLDSYSE